MNHRLLIVAVCCLLAGCQAADTTKGSLKLKNLKKEKGQQLFMHHCAPCHGKLAKGGVAGPDLTVSRFKYGKTQTDIIKTVTSGRSGGMPAFGSHLKPEEISALANYLLSLK